MFATDPDLDGRGLRVAIVASRFNPDLTQRLVEGCERRLEELGAEVPEVVWVPGAFELPLAVKALLAAQRYDAVVAVGVVIRGGTPHFDYVCRVVADGLREVTLGTGVPVAFSVLTTDNRDQALERSVLGAEPGSNKGAEGAAVAVEMARLVTRLAARH
jgi:6,7-dimethyl-8-ribityllumazine synthase